jgi:hypothetical protein
MFVAILKRWIWQLGYGMWLGYCDVTLWQYGRVIVIGAGVPTKTRGVFQPYRVFWQRPAQLGKGDVHER